MKQFSLYELNEYIRRVFALNFPEGLWVRAEISQCKMSRGHWYLELVEQEAGETTIIARASAALWRLQYQRLKRQHSNELNSLLREGVEVLLLVRVDFHERYGLKLIIEDIDPAYTVGKLELHRRAIIAELEKSHLLDKNSQLPLPPVIQHIAVFSNETAAGYKDFLNQLTQNDYQFKFEIRLFTVALQGKNVESEMLAQMEALSKSNHTFDAIVIIRGGGAKLDLAAFDNLEIAKKVAALDTPVLTGIGHEQDATVLDAVAHTALKTPTAVAEFLIHRCLVFESNLSDHWRMLQRSVMASIQTEQLKMQELAQQLRFIAREQVQLAAGELSTINEKLPQLSNVLLSKANLQLDHLDSLSRSLSPEAIMRRGFSVTQYKGKVLQNESTVQKGDTIETILKKGRIQSTVD